jgi:hypothetical protein
MWIEQKGVKRHCRKVIVAPRPYNDHDLAFEGGCGKAQLTESGSAVSSGLGEGKGTAVGESETNETEGETEGDRVGSSSGDLIRVNMGDGEGDELRRAPTSVLFSDAIDC